MPTFQPFVSFEPTQQYKNVTALVLCCITLYEHLTVLPCGPKQIGVLSVEL